jgi:small subunit ribosomal protein S27Ae
MSKKPPKKEEVTPAPGETQKTEEKKEVKPQKVEKVRKEKKKRQEKGAHALYKIEGDKAARLRPTCERCGTGYFMGDHNDRYTCGHCGFTRYKRAEK